jgi:hypothetical protein
MLQWTPGAGQEPTYHKRWWPLYHKTVEAGKKVLISCDTIDTLKVLKKEFGQKLKHFLINMGAKSPEHAEGILEVAGD